MNIQDFLAGDILSGTQGQVKHVLLDATTPTYNIKPTEHIIIAISSEADAAGILYLPPKAEAVGKFYYICAPTGAAGGDISVYDKESNSEITTHGDMDADDDSAIFFCDGYKWRTAFNGVA